MMWRSGYFVIGLAAGCPRFPPIFWRVAQLAKLKREKQRIQVQHANDSYSSHIIAWPFFGQK